MASILSLTQFVLYLKMTEFIFSLEQVPISTFLPVDHSRHLFLPVTMSLCDWTGLISGRCWQHRPDISPVHAFWHVYREPSDSCLSVTEFLFFLINHTLVVYLFHRVFKPSFWLAGSTAASQSEALSENPCCILIPRSGGFLLVDVYA